MPVTVWIRNDDPSNTSEGTVNLTFDGPRVVLGRSAGSDVRIPDVSVSLRHATIHEDGANYTLMDEGSTNGTYVGNARLAPRTPRVLKSGDMVRLGRVWLEVRVDQRPPTRDLAQATRDLAVLLVSQALARMGEETVPALHVEEGRDTGARFPLVDDGSVYVIGRSADCDVPLADPDISREHVEVVRHGPVVYVRDLGSRNGAYLGQDRLPPREATTWKPGVRLRVGRTVLLLDEPVSSALLEIENLADEPLDRDAAFAIPSPVADASPAITPQAEPVSPPEPAPIAMTPPVARRARLSIADMTVISVTIFVLALSLAGLFWLFRS
jgi:pSer/pThr/pTyr-binding forkhead associated (FHA) protein